MGWLQKAGAQLFPWKEAELWPPKARDIDKTEPSLLEVVQHQSPCDKGSLVQVLRVTSGAQHHSSCSQVDSCWVWCQRCCKDLVSVTFSQTKATAGACALSDACWVLGMAFAESL